MLKRMSMPAKPKKKNTTASRAAALLGRLGGKAGRGKSKRRPKSHCRRAALIRWKKNKRTKSPTGSTATVGSQYAYTVYWNHGNSACGFETRNDAANFLVTELPNIEKHQPTKGRLKHKLRS